MSVIHVFSDYCKYLTADSPDYQNTVGENFFVYILNINVAVLSFFMKDLKRYSSFYY
jgi:hypothetical protein